MPRCPALILSSALLVCSLTTLARGEAARPAGAPSGPVVAEVHARIGAGSTLRAGGKTFPAAPGTALLREDELVVPAGQVLVVALRNGHLVRLDDDITLRVGQIVLVDAPASKEPLAAQLDRLLSKEERGRAERIAGVQARVAGASAAGGVEADTRSKPNVGGDEEPAREERPGRNKASPSPSKPKPSTTETPPPRQAPLRIAPATPPGNAPRAEDPAAPPPISDRKAPNGRASAPDPAPVASAPEPEATKARALPGEAKLKACLTQELGRLPVRVEQVQLRLWIVGGKISRAALGGGLALPACARSLLVGAALSGAEGRWTERELRLR